jgi:hypothetical protein
MCSLVNRTADNWRPLFAIADLAGGTWPERARNAARALSHAVESDSLFEETLAAIREMIGRRDEITSKEIIDRLVKIEDGPWAEWGKDHKPITQNALARLLKPHKVFPSDIGPEWMRRKGYRRSQFEQLFEAYLKAPPPPPPDNRAAAQDAMEPAQAEHSEPRSPDSDCADGHGEKPNHDGLLRGCADAQEGCGPENDPWADPPTLQRPGCPDLGAA